MTERRRQPIDALAEANKIRSYRTRVRQEIRAARNGRESRHRLAGLLVQPIPRELKTLHVQSLLCYPVRMQAQTASLMIRAAGASPVIRAGDLTLRQRLLLASLLDGDARTLEDALLARELR